MAKVRNVSGQDLVVPGRGLIEADAVMEVPDGAAYSYTAQSGVWEPVDKKTQDLHDKAEKRS